MDGWIRKGNESRTLYDPRLLLAPPVTLSSNVLPRVRATYTIQFQAPLETTLFTSLNTLYFKRGLAIYSTSKD
jgi:hypothetical protein